MTNHRPVTITGLPDEAYSIYNKPDRISILIYSPGLRPACSLATEKNHKTKEFGLLDNGDIIALIIYK